MNTIKIFSEPWIQAWKKAINSSDEYKSHGSGWSDPLILKFNSPVNRGTPNEIPGFYLLLQNGTCETLRYSNPEDESATDTVLSADAETWQQIIIRQKDPVFMLLQGRIRLEKGSLMKMTSRRAAAKALLKAAGDVSKEMATRSADIDTSPQDTSIQQPTVAENKFHSTGRGLDFNAFPMQLFQKAKDLGTWNPASINFSRDRKEWQSFNELEQTVLLHLSSMFLAGEEAVTLDLLPLIQTVASEGRIEEEIYLTSFLWEEAKHTEFFALFLRDVVGDTPDLASFHGPHYKSLFYEELHQALHRLQYDKSPETQLKASITYNLIVEGTLAETGYEAYHRMLSEEDMLPGLREGIGLLKRDESRHIAFGLYFIERLLTEHPDLREIFEDECARLLDRAIEVVHEIFEPYPEMPFGLEKSWYIDYASSQFSKRMKKLSPQQP